MPRSSSSSPTPHLAWIYGVIHAVVDAASVTVVFAAGFVHDLHPAEAFALVLAYDLLAFGSQFLLGLLVDARQDPGAAVRLGLLLTTLGTAALRLEPVTAMVLVGLGNALFHVGAGAVSLSLAPGRAAPAGIFVAPGALGLGFGLWFGHSGAAVEWPFALALAASLLATRRVRNPEHPGRRAAPPVGPSASPEFPLVVAGLLLLTVALRSFVGLAGCHGCPRGTMAAVLLPLAAFGGKALGGFLADRLGWIATSVGALAASAPLIAYGGDDVPRIAAGLLLFQTTMPVTLAALAQVLPGRPAFAFGLACLALVGGALPTFFPGTRLLYGPPVLLALILLSATAVYVALRLLSAPPRAARPTHTTLALAGRKP